MCECVRAHVCVRARTCVCVCVCVSTARTPHPISACGHTCAYTGNGATNPPHICYRTCLCPKQQDPHHNHLQPHLSVPKATRPTPELPTTAPVCAQSNKTHTIITYNRTCLCPKQQDPHHNHLQPHLSVPKATRPTPESPTTAPVSTLAAGLCANRLP